MGPRPRRPVRNDASSPWSFRGKKGQGTGQAGEGGTDGQAGRGVMIRRMRGERYEDQRETESRGGRTWDRVQLRPSVPRPGSAVAAPSQGHGANRVSVSAISRAFPPDPGGRQGPRRLRDGLYSVYLYPNQFRVGCRTPPNRICRPSHAKERHPTPSPGESGPVLVPKELTTQHRVGRAAGGRGAPHGVLSPVPRPDTFMS